MENQELHPLTEKVKNVIEQIRPYLQNDGGDIKFITITPENVVHVELQGACHSCPMAVQTMKGGVEATIKQHIPEIESVVAINMAT